MRDRGILLNIKQALPSLPEQERKVADYVLEHPHETVGCSITSLAAAVIFGASPKVLNLAGRALQIGALEQVPLAVHMVLAGGLRGAGDTRTPMYVTMFGVLFFRVAVVYLFAITLDWGLAGVWLGTSVDWIGRAALMVVLFRRGRWKSVRV